MGAPDVPLHRRVSASDDAVGSGAGLDRTLWAYDQQDAEARLDAIRRAGHVEGQVLEAGTW